MEKLRPVLYTKNSFIWKKGHLSESIIFISEGTAKLMIENPFVSKEMPNST